MDFTKFQSLLDEQMSWPDFYIFKFVTKTEVKSQLIELLDGHQIQEKLSKNGKYTSVTSRKMMNSSDEVVSVYKTVAQLEGIITL